jgi:hypothetical protein
MYVFSWCLVGDVLCVLCIVCAVCLIVFVCALVIGEGCVSEA